MNTPVTVPSRQSKSIVSPARNFFRPLFCAWAAAIMVLLGGVAVVQAQPQSRWSGTNTQGLWASGGWSGSALQDASTVMFSNNAVLTTTNNANSGWRYTGLYMTADATSDRVIVGDFNLFGEYSGGRSKIEISTAPNYRTLTISGNVSINGNRNQRYEINPVGGSIILGSISGLQTNSGGVNNTLHMYGNNAENDMVRSVVVSNGINGTGGGANILKLLNYANLVLMGNSTYTGNAEIDTGTLMLGQGTIDGTLNNNTAIYVGSGTVNGNATLRLGKTDGGQVLGGGAVLQINTNPLGGRRTIQSDNTAGTNTVARVISNNAQLFITNAAGGTLRFEGAFANSNNNVVINGGGTNAIVEFAAANSFSNVYIDYGQARFDADNSWGVGAIVMGRTAEDTRAATASFTSDFSVGAGFEVRTNAGDKTILYTAGSGILTLAGAITNNATVPGGLKLDVASGGTMHASGALTGNGTPVITKAGGGTFIASGTSVGNKINLADGTIVIGADGALSTSTATDTRAIDMGFDGAFSTANNVALYASNGVTVSNSIYVAPNDSSATRTIGVVDASSGATFNNEIYLGGSAQLVAGAGSQATFSGNFVDAGGIGKTGIGTVTLSGDNSFSGDTTVSAGTLKLDAALGGALAGTASVAVGSGATLLISKSDQVNNSAAVTLSGGTIKRESGVSEVFGNLNLTTASFLDYGSGTEGTLTFGTYTPSSLLTVNNFFEGNKLVFSSNLTGQIEGNFTFDNGFTTDWNGSTFTITAIPEPSACTAAAGLAGLMLWSLRRRCAKCA